VLRIPLDHGFDFDLFVVVQDHMEAITEILTGGFNVYQRPWEAEIEVTVFIAFVLVK
jgi:hypothetical protein